MTEQEKKLIEQGKRTQARIKRQNEAMKNNWDRVSCTLPKGTKERIAATGESVNGLINRLVLAELEKLNV